MSKNGIPSEMIDNLTTGERKIFEIGYLLGMNEMMSRINKIHKKMAEQTCSEILGKRKSLYIWKIYPEMYEDDGTQYVVLTNRC